MSSLALFGRERRRSDAGTEWLSVADLMAGLMLAFLLISVLLTQQALSQRDTVNSLAEEYRDGHAALAGALDREFSEQLKAWNARFDNETLTLSFDTPEVAFAPGGSEISDSYQRVLADFFPRYLDVILQHRHLVDELRIEGHTSSRWAEGTDPAIAYFNNMALSQARARAVLNHVFFLSTVRTERDWMSDKVVAVGMSSARPVLGPDGLEDFSLSRRVSFRVITNSDAQLRRIIERAAAGR
ncbi:MAG: OmpA family protein [Pseudomonadota bacterium]